MNLYLVMESGKYGWWRSCLLETNSVVTSLDTTRRRYVLKLQNNSRDINAIVYVEMKYCNNLTSPA